MNRRIARKICKSERALLAAFARWDAFQPEAIAEARAMHEALCRMWKRRCVPPFQEPKPTRADLRLFRRTFPRYTTEQIRRAAHYLPRAELLPWAADVAQHDARVRFAQMSPWEKTTASMGASQTMLGFVLSMALPPSLPSLESQGIAP